MITRIYIHNFRTLEDFTVKLGEVNLFMGANGCGKTSVFDAVRQLQSFICGDCNVDDAFKKRDITCWAQKKEMRIELDMSLPEGEFTYAICVGHVDGDEEWQVTDESLKADGEMLFCRDLEGTLLCYDTGDRCLFPPFDTRTSILPIFREQPDNTKLIAFRRQMSQIVTAAINPFAMEVNSRQEDKVLASDMSNFVSWYRKIMVKNPDKVGDVFKALRDGPMPDFRYYSFDDVGQDVKTFNVHFSAPEAQDYTINFGRLSLGQKVLIVLYILTFGIKGSCVSLFLDEPDNFVMLREIQPWLAMLRDAKGESFRQLTLISHHPQLIDGVGVHGSQWFFRDNGGKTQLKDYTPILEGSSLALSEHIVWGNFE